MPRLIFLMLCLVILFYQTTAALAAQEAPDLVAARKARDHASVAELQKLVAVAEKAAVAKQSLEAYLQLALFNVWLCEAIESHQDDKLFKQAAEAGVAAAEKAVALDPNSSDAHQLLGDLLSQLIPHVYGGGMRYGQRATAELERAIELNPKNVNAYVSRAISYYYSPDSFGGSKPKAFELLKKAVEIDAAQDAPHIWLALFALDAGQLDAAQREIKLALKANPERAFTQFVNSQIMAAQKAAAHKKP
jgi:tetratricopeptide (TPR) repeat protein